ncbi:MAG: hypothetical protein Q8N23_02265 [Archangium sp.]|nr:hypothetical protein [Archangium sp.]MDP3575357.1 hypothetical protein [Archangium sp.]
MEKTPYQIAQRRRHARWKETTVELPIDARRPGRWREARDVPFILPIERADHNLWDRIRPDVLSYFAEFDIEFHDGRSEDYDVRPAPGPSPHLLDSQIYALNFWWPLQENAAVLAGLLRTVFPSVVRMVPPVAAQRLVEFEWIGAKNHLGEKERDRRRGRFATSADALLAYEDPSGQRHGVLLESKYTEAYPAERWTHRSRWGTDRVAIYRPSFELPDGPFEASVELDQLFVEPFDQHLRQQLLAAAMERSHELEFTTVSCLHVAPRENVDFHRGITSPGLRTRGASVGEVWKSLLKDPTRYASLAYEDAFDFVAASATMPFWAAYQRDRFGHRCT